MVPILNQNHGISGKYFPSQNMRTVLKVLSPHTSWLYLKVGAAVGAGSGAAAICNDIADKEEKGKEWLASLDYPSIILKRLGPSKLAS